MRIFNYTTFSTRLEKSTRTLHLEFFDQNDHGTIETLFELESLINWSKERVEINSILISSQSALFNLGLTNEKISGLKSSYLEKVFNKVAKLSQSFMDLPQNVIFDLGAQPSSLVFQLSLGADNRIIPSDSVYDFNPLSQGLSVAAGSLSVASTLFSQAIARKTLIGGSCTSQQLENWAVCETYQKEKRITFVYGLLNTTNEQAPITRIQMKLALTLMVKQTITSNLKIEENAYKPLEVAQDWTNFKVEEKSEFTPAQHMAYILQYVNKQEHADKREVN